MALSWLKQQVPWSTSSGKIFAYTQSITRLLPTTTVFLFGGASGN